MKGPKEGLRSWGGSKAVTCKSIIPGLAANPVGIQTSAKELVDRQCEVIVARSTPVVAALLRETRTIPIVFLGGSLTPLKRLRAELPASRRKRYRLSKSRIFRWSANGLSY